MNALKIEWLKAQRRRIWLAPLIILAAQLAWGLYNYKNMQPAELVQGWASILYTFPLLNAMMMPILAAVTASRLIDVEHKGKTFKLLETLQRTETLYDAKFICAALYILLMILLQITVMLVFGLLRGFEGPIPWDKVALYALSTVLVTLTILLMQFLLSLLIENQLVGMIVGLIGAFAGLFALFFPAALQKAILWAYYGVLSGTAMDWDRETRAVDYYFMPYAWKSFIFMALVFAALYIVGRRLFVRKEV